MHKTINVLLPVVLVVLDGWGIREETEHNAIALAHTPHMDSFLRMYPHTELIASGEHVGLPSEQFGNSEVGHMTMGAGTVIDQDLVRINKDIHENTLKEHAVLNELCSYVKDKKGSLHIVGLFSPGGVHSHEQHFLSMIEEALRSGVSSIILHPFLDGRDTFHTSGATSLERLEQLCVLHHEVHIGSVSGRYYSMDRDNNYERTDKAFQAIVFGQADTMYSNDVLPSEVIKAWYQKGIYDEHIEPFVMTTKSGTGWKLKEGDGMITTNFRKDRMRQLVSRLEEYIDGKDIHLVTMTKYTDNSHASVVYPKQSITVTLGSELSAQGYRQARIAETEKYAHVTYFFNGGSDVIYPQQENILIPSRRDIKTHDEAPEMKAKEITDEALQRLNTYEFLLMNYANADMVGHSANENAIVQAIESIDSQLGRLADAVLSVGGTLLITSDHGNAEMTVDIESGLPRTSHTSNHVPFCFIHAAYKPTLRSDGTLKDIAPTILELFRIQKPTQMTGSSLIDETISGVNDIQK